MAIDRYALVSRHNPVLEAADPDSPLTVGNGELAFTADVTGLQTLYKEYLDTCPLCTMSQWGWHTKPVSGERYEYTLKDLVMTEFDYNGRKVVYPKNPKPGNEEVYDWPRKNLHRLDLARIGFEYEDKEISADRLTGIRQELDLYSGILKSGFLLDGKGCQVETACDNGAEGESHDTIGIRVKSSMLREGALSVAVTFPYGSPAKSAADFDSPALHRTELVRQDGRFMLLKRTLDRDVYYVRLVFGEGVKAQLAEGDSDCVHGHRVVVKAQGEELELAVSFLRGDCNPEAGGETHAGSMTEDAMHAGTGAEDAARAEGLRANPAQISAAQVFEDSRRYWKGFWEKGAILKLHDSPDPRAEELERRIILSMYLLAVNSCGSAPPQETGLTCNSWYGKMHLEMYFWHCAWAPLWGHTELLERSLPWYLEHMEEARENAARNGYKGCRWPKMIALDGIDSPSKVAPMLLWQQPHIIFMLELCFRENHDDAFRRKYWPLVKETADFMADIAVYNQEKGCYELVAPVIPVQECHRPEDTLNPAFEVSYWRYTLETAVRWAKELGMEYDPRWEEVGGKMASLTEEDGCYLAHERCHTTFTVQNHDHPSMLMSYGVLADERLSPEIMGNTLRKVLECWSYPSLWGWDFAVMAMTAARLGDPSQAVDILLKDTPKNQYVRSGNNNQIIRKDLPLYLPGNGSLLLAIPMLAEGYEGCGRRAPGFPEGWAVEAEGLQKYI